MFLPTMHINGTSKERLKEPLYEASNHIRDAIRILEGEGAPNARDYYPQGPQAIMGAAREHADRLARLHSVRAEVNQLIEHIENT